MITFFITWDDDIINIDHLVGQVSIFGVEEKKSDCIYLVQIQVELESS